MAAHRRLTAAIATLLLMAANADATTTTIHFVNQCEDPITWYDGSDSRALATGAHHTAQLAAGDNAAYRAGVTNDATLAEFAVDEGNTWFDISIIPAGPLGGPGSCSSLEECKEVTGGEGFNVAMRIVPSRSGKSSTSVCRTLSCLEDGCDDAYQYPDQDGKTHNCAAGISFEVIFCPSDTSASSSSSFTSESDSSSTDWVPLDSSSASAAYQDAADTDAAASSSALVASDAESKTSTRSGTTSSSSFSPSTGSEQQVGNNSSNSAPDSSSSAVIVAAVLGATVVVIVLSAVVARHWRALVLKWEAAHWHKPRTSSPTLSFVKVDDYAASP